MKRLAQVKNYTASCGLYCADCNRSKTELIALASTLEKQLHSIRFDKYAAYKAAASPEFGEYPVFLQVLQAISGLGCETCNCKSSEVSCHTRKCVLSKRLQGCWECPEVATCALLEPLKQRHPFLEHNHNCIRQFGIDNWHNQRGKHYSWD